MVQDVKQAPIALNLLSGISEHLQTSLQKIFEHSQRLQRQAKEEEERQKREAEEAKPAAAESKPTAAAPPPVDKTAGVDPEARPVTRARRISSGIEVRASASFSALK